MKQTERDHLWSRSQGRRDEVWQLRIGTTPILKSWGRWRETTKRYRGWMANIVTQSIVERLLAAARKLDWTASRVDTRKPGQEVAKMTSHRPETWVPWKISPWDCPSHMESTKTPTWTPNVSFPKSNIYPGRVGSPGSPPRTLHCLCALLRHLLLTA